MLTIEAPERTTQAPSFPVFNRPHWSYSQLNQYLRCPLQFYFERVLRLERPFVPSTMALGSTVHEALAEYHRHLQANQPLADHHVQRTFLHAWEASEARQPVQFRDGEDREGVLAQGIAVLETYLQEPAPQNILAVEEPMMVPLHNSQGDFLEKPLVAVVDLLHRDEGANLVVSEFKTSGRRFSESEAETTLQASCYVHAVQERFDEPVGVRYVVLVKTKKPAVQYLSTARCDSDLGRLGDVVQAVERAIDADVYYPIESPMTCSGCPFYRPCREWKGFDRSHVRQEARV